MMFSLWARADCLNHPSPPSTPPNGLRCSPSLRPHSASHKHNNLSKSQQQSDKAFNLVGRHPFAPRTPADITIGDIVKFSRQGGKISKGIVKYIGHLPGKNDTYLGVELEHEIGKHDGVYDGQRYFQSRHNRGVFVAFSKVVMAWSGADDTL